MKPVDQTITTHPEGNCFPACLASILEIPLEEVPHAKGEGWQYYYNQWLRPRGLALITVGLPADIQTMSPELRRYHMPGYTILAVQSPRYDCLHSVVCLDGEIVHDPHPLRAMGVGAWKELDLLIAIDAGRIMQAHQMQAQQSQTKQSKEAFNGNYRTG